MGRYKCSRLSQLRGALNPSRHLPAHTCLHRAEGVHITTTCLESAGEYGLSWTIIRPTAYFKDFTDMPWKHMQVKQKHS